MRVSGGYATPFLGLRNVHLPKRAERAFKKPWRRRREWRAARSGRGFPPLWPTTGRPVQTRSEEERRPIRNAMIPSFILTMWLLGLLSVAMAGARSG